jgi:hypothetical protein
MDVLIKIWQWVLLFAAGNIGIVQAGIKFVKEVLTLIVDILFPIMPIKTFQSVVLSVRGIVNSIDEVVEKIKQYLIPKAV